MAHVVECLSIHEICVYFLSCFLLLCLFSVRACVLFFFVLMCSRLSNVCTCCIAFVLKDAFKEKCVVFNSTQFKKKKKETTSPESGGLSGGKKPTP